MFRTALHESFWVMVLLVTFPFIIVGAAAYLVHRGLVGGYNLMDDLTDLLAE